MHQFRRTQTGVVLVVALIMMAVIAISSAAAIKAVLTEDKVGLNQRLQSIARQNAEAMLRYCEAVVTSNIPTTAQLAIINQRIQPNTKSPRNWEDLSKWSDANVVVDAPDNFDGSGYTTGKKSQCIIERTDIVQINDRSGASGPSPMTIGLITARGFSPDYAQNAQGVTSAGAVVWLQSTVHMPYVN